MPSAKVIEKTAPATKRAVLELGDTKKGDLGDVAAAVEDAETLHKAKEAPSASLVLFAKVGKDTGSAASKALKEVAGVDAGGVKADEKAGEIVIPLMKGEKKKQASLAAILKALKGAAIEAKTTAKKG